METEKLDIEAWKERKKLEREETVMAQKEALTEVVKTGSALGEYLLGRGRLGSHLTSGNAALVLKANPQARVVMSFTGWKNFGRSVGKGQKGITVLTRQNGYLTTDQLFELSQTNGNRAYPMPTLGNDPKELYTVVKALIDLATVPVVQDEDYKGPAIYDSEREAIVCDKNAPLEEHFRHIPAAIVMGLTQQIDEENAGSELTKLYALAVSVELCGRYGIEPIPGYKELLDGFAAHVEEGQERPMLEEIREFSRTMGDHVSKALGAYRTTRAAEQRDDR